MENGVIGDASDKGRVDLTQHVNMDYFIALYVYINKYVVYYLNWNSVSLIALIIMLYRYDFPWLLQNLYENISIKYKGPTDVSFKISVALDISI